MQAHSLRWCALDALGSSGSFDAHGVTVGRTGTDLGPRKAGFSAKIVEISIESDPLNRADFHGPWLIHPQATATEHRVHYSTCVTFPRV